MRMTDRSTVPVTEDRFQKLAKRVDRAERRLHTLEQQADETYYEEHCAERAAQVFHIEPDDVSVYTERDSPRATFRVPLLSVNRLSGHLNGDSAYEWELLGVDEPPERPVTDVYQYRDFDDEDHESEPVYVQIRQRSMELDL